MGLFSDSSSHRKTKWVSLVMGDSSGDISEEVLKRATDSYIAQHSRILQESIKLFLTSKNKETRKSRYKLACEHYSALIKVKKFADKSQKKSIDKIVDDFIKADDLFRHPDRAKAQNLIAQKKRQKDEFWEGYGLIEMIELFSEDWE